MRIALGVEYDGSAYSGWQTQKNATSVQQLLEKALSIVADRTVTVVCAGRTDTGVHALGQVVHFDTIANRKDKAWVLGGNANLPTNIRIIWAKGVDDAFHARFSAVNRRYLYIIYSHKIRPAHLSNLVTWTYHPLNIEQMSAGAKYLLGKHDFSSFRSYACQANSPLRTIYYLKVYAKGAYIYIDVEANAFLHHMVRNIAGVLISVGANEKKPVWVKQVLDAKDRVKGGVTAKPNGLYLMSVTYEDKFYIPELLRTPFVC